jgi:prepilin-type N-terminal cleavage/methylation domain-containing protein
MKKSLKTNEKGFSLIELIVVMAIIALLIGLGTESLIRFRSTVEVQEAGRQLVSQLNLLKNSAKNDVRPPELTQVSDIKGYQLLIDDNELDLNVCTSPTVNTAVQRWAECSPNEQLSQRLLELSINVNFTEDSVSDIQNADQCDSVFFESLTGDIRVSDSGTNTGSADTQTNDICYIAYQDNDERLQQFILVDGLEDNFKIYRNVEDINNATN